MDRIAHPNEVIAQVNRLAIATENMMELYSQTQMATYYQSNSRKKLMTII